MSTIGELIAAKKTAPTRFEDVDVLWDADVSDQIAALEDQIVAAQQDQRLSSDNGEAELQQRIETLRQDNADEIVTFRFKKIDGYKWAELCGKFPPDLANPMHLRVGGYNLDEVSKEAAKIGGSRLNGDDEEPLTSEQWDDVFHVLSGHDVAHIRDIIWNLNEWEPTQRLAAAKKARIGSEDGSTSL